MVLPSLTSTPCHPSSSSHERVKSRDVLSQLYHLFKYIFFLFCFFKFLHINSITVIFWHQQYNQLLKRKTNVPGRSMVKILLDSLNYNVKIKYKLEVKLLLYVQTRGNICTLCFPIPLDLSLTLRFLLWGKFEFYYG